MPTRKEININQIVAKTQEYKKPKIQLHGTTLMARLQAIESNVNKNLSGYECLLLDSDEKWLAYCKKASESEYIALDTETTGIEFKDQVNGLVGVCIMSSNQIEAYAPVGHISVITEMPLGNQVSKQAIKEGIDLLVNKGCKFIFHNAYYDIVVMRSVLGYFIPIYWDTMPASFLLNENEPHGLKYLWDKYVMEGSAGVHKFAELFDGIPFSYIKPSVGMKYAAHDARMTYELFKFQKPYLTKGTEECNEYNLSGVVDVFEKEELPIIPVLAEVKYRGINIDTDIAHKLHDKYTKLREEALAEFNKAVKPLRADILERARLYNDIEYPINYNSPNQIKTLIYTILNSGVIFEKEPTGTGKHVLDTVMAEPKYKGTTLYNIVKALQEVKKYDKALGTFIDSIPKIASEYGSRLHGNFNSCAARTGRLSSSNINYQQIPSKLGDIRNMFTAGKGRVFIGADYSREEVAVCSAICNDAKLIQSFIDGTDVYSYVASLAYDVPYEDCLEHYPDGTTNHEGKTRRSSAKAIVLGILYSKSVKAIGEDLHVSTEKAQEIYDSVMKAFPTMAKWIDDTQEQAKKCGYVDGFYGRRRRLPDLLLPRFNVDFKIKLDERSKEYYKNLYLGKLTSTNKLKEQESIIADAKRKGIIIEDNRGKISKSGREIVNSVVQGSSADICKKALILIGTDEVLKKLDAKLELTIHDEQIISCPEENAYEASQRLVYLAKKAGEDLPIELLVDVAISKVWYGEEYTFDEDKNLVLMEKSLP